MYYLPAIQSIMRIENILFCWFHWDGGAPISWSMCTLGQTEYTLKEAINFYPFSAFCVSKKKVIRICALNDL